MLLLSAADVAELLTLDAVFAATREAAIAHSELRTQRIARTALHLLARGHAENAAQPATPDARGELLVMPEVVDQSVFGVKTWHSFEHPVAESGARSGAGSGTRSGAGSASTLAQTGSLIYLIDGESGEQAILDGSQITDWRTGALSGLAAALYAPENSRRLAVIGSGRQARSQALALVHAVPTLEWVSVWSRSPKRREEFAAQLTRDFAGAFAAGSRPVAVTVTAANSAPKAVIGADIVVAATTSTRPVVVNAWLAAPVLVCGVGSHTIAAAEIDPRAVARADTVVVDTLAGAADTSGDIALAIARHGLDRARVVELGAVLGAVGGGVASAGARSGVGGDGAGMSSVGVVRTGTAAATSSGAAAGGATSAGESAAPRTHARRDGMTVFKSVGFAAADVAVAAAVTRLAVARGVGTRIDLSSQQ
ncbi:MAG: ornithine cyclodeaminase family protein [Subtercola sp.]|nr:ornithine cyclodeaminase family protein [Subtercola sp.]